MGPDTSRASFQTMGTPSTSTTEITRDNEPAPRKTGVLLSLKDVQRSWRTHIGFDFWAEGNNLVDHLGK